MTYKTFDGTEIREEVYARVRSGEITLDEAQAIELYLKKVEYRQTYNQRPEVKAKRAAYMKKRNAKASVGRQLLNQLLGTEEDGN